jgi:hypothetical protein
LLSFTWLSIKVFIQRSKESPVEADVMDDAPPKAKQKGMSKKSKDEARQSKIELTHCDIIKDAFWDSRPSLLA